ncbi:MAG TPA: hypothetical protein VLJ76_01965 [Gaiellaceae bacterium]|nr:hypothetical protein [Gaiellaceae bacterium]
MTAPGLIVVLNGAPRAGKSSIAAAIQASFDGTWLNLGVDLARIATSPRAQPGIGLRPGEPDHPVAALLPALFSAWYESIASHSRAGLSVVADLGHHDAEILADCARRLDWLPAWLVGVRCPVDAIIERRATTMPAPRERVELWERSVHDPGIYDLEVDTSLLSPDECAEAIRQRLQGPAPTAFARLAQS